MFVGEYLHAVDSKGRLALPARFRAKIERGAVLSRGFEPCLYIYPLETWEHNSQRIAEAAISAEQRRRIERRFFAMAYEIELDAQGRIVVPAKFRTYAGLNGEATVLGARDRIEVWNTERWDAYTAEMRDDELVGLPLPF